MILENLEKRNSEKWRPEKGCQVNLCFGNVILETLSDAGGFQRSI